MNSTLSAPELKIPIAGSTWRILSTPPMTGADNMDFDSATLDAVDKGDAPPTLRVFRWSEPTVTHGRLQKEEEVRKLTPPNWPIIMRPTGGGIVLHDQDLCVSLAWVVGQTPLPTSLKDTYAWIHGVLQKALKPFLNVSMASCEDCDASPEFHARQCFQEPVAYDLVTEYTKVVGGAIARRHAAFLYQGSIQLPANIPLERAVRLAFEQALR